MNYILDWLFEQIRFFKWYAKSDEERSKSMSIGELESILKLTFGKDIGGLLVNNYIEKCIYCDNIVTYSSRKNFGFCRKHIYLLPHNYHYYPPRTFPMIEN